MGRGWTYVSVIPGAHKYNDNTLCFPWCFNLNTYFDPGNFVLNSQFLVYDHSTRYRICHRNFKVGLDISSLIVLL